MQYAICNMQYAICNMQYGYVDGGMKRMANHLG